METILAFRMQRHDSWAKKSHALSLAAEKRGCRLQIIDQPSTQSDIEKLAAFWHPRGIVVAETPNGQTKFDAAAFKGIPTVFMDCSTEFVNPGFGLVIHDAKAISETAIREFLQIGCASIAYVGWFESTHWSEDKRKACREILALHGMELLEFIPRKEKAPDVFSVSKSLRTWVAALPENCGIFVVNDAMAEMVTDIVGKCGRQIPYDIAIIGVDEDETVGERAVPSLSTIALDYEASAEAVMKCLWSARGAAKRRESAVTLVPPLKLVRRQTSRRFANKDSAAEAAVELIRRKACEGLKAADVFCLFPCSRRQAEARFRRVTGKSILDEIIGERIAKAQELLRNPRVWIGSIADMCGFPSNTVLQRQFKARTGKSMREWRRSLSARGARGGGAHSSGDSRFRRR